MVNSTSHSEWVNRAVGERRLIVCPLQNLRLSLVINLKMINAGTNQALTDIRIARIRGLHEFT